MARDSWYRALVGSKMWARLATETKNAAGWKCQRCGIITHRLAVHHIRPVEAAATRQEMQRLCFDRGNLEVLCYQCHADEHRNARRGGRQQAAERERARTDRFVRMFAQEGLPSEPRPETDRGAFFPEGAAIFGNPRTEWSVGTGGAEAPFSRPGADNPPCGLIPRGNGTDLEENAKDGGGTRRKNT